MSKQLLPGRWWGVKVKLHGFSVRRTEQFLSFKLQGKEWGGGISACRFGPRQVETPNLTNCFLWDFLMPNNTHSSETTERWRRNHSLCYELNLWNTGENLQLMMMQTAVFPPWNPRGDPSRSSRGLVDIDSRPEVLMRCLLSRLHGWGLFAPAIHGSINLYMKAGSKRAVKSWCVLSDFPHSPS